MTHTDATRLLAQMAFRHRETFTTQDRLKTLEACSVVLDDEEAAKAKEALVQLEAAVRAADEASRLQVEFVTILEGAQ